MLRYYFALLFSSSVFATTAAAEYIYTIAGCEYSVAFPAAPEIKTLFTSATSKKDSANYAGESYILRAECTDIERVAGDREIIKGQVIEYAEQNGLQNPIFEFADGPLGYMARVKGYKNIGGLQGTFVAVAYVGRTSTLMLYTGSPSASYPQDGVYTFMNSVKFKPAQ